MLCILLCAIALGVSAKRQAIGYWTMETPDKVVGREGKHLILFCKFTHPHREYRGNISVAWRHEKGSEFLNYTNFQLGGKFENEILVNAENRYKLRGNPRMYDASILIEKLMPEDKKKIKCRVDLTEKPGEKFELLHGTIKIKDGGIRASPVIGKRGDSAILPWSFKPLTRNASSIVILWMKGNPREEFTAFNHTCSHSADPPCTATVNKGGQYELVGNPGQGNASIRVTDLRMNDTNHYFCHVWIRNKNNEIVMQDDTKLEVVVPAAILQLLIVTGDTLLCTAEGVPPADITWIDPGNNTLTVNSSGTRVTRGSERDQITVELLQPRLRGSYHCVAENQYRKDSREIFLPKRGMNVFMLALYIGSSSSAVTLLLTAFGLWFMKKDSHKGRSSVDPSVANDLKSQGAEPDSQESSDAVIYSTVHIRRRSEVEAMTDPQESPSISLYSNVQSDSRAKEETAVIYATVVYSNKQSLDASED